MAKKTIPVKRTPFLSTGYATALCVFILIAATLAVFLPQLGNGLTNWDDDKYILGNADITQLDATHIGKVFSSTYVGNYQPITMLVYLIEYGISGADPGIYHAVSLFFHLLNSVLVFLLLFTLCRNRWASLAAALLFAVHPLRVESVAWAAEQKDVVCGMFFMVSLLLYLWFMEKRTGWLYGVSLLSFILALGSKPMAVSLPMLLFLLDYVTERKLSLRTVIEKVPYIVLAVAFGLVTMLVQHKGGIAMDYSGFPAWMRVCIPFYGALWYIVKTILPAHLSALYTFTLYPDMLHIILYVLSPIVVLVSAVAAYFSRERTRVIVFGLLWYIVALLPVLQIVRAGDALTADRYTYLPVIGLCCMAAYGLARIPWKRMNSIHRRAVFFFIVLLIVVYGAAAHERTMVWRSSTTLWNNVIANYPQTVMAWYNRGMAYLDAQETGQAIADFSKAIALNPDYLPPYTNRGIAYGMMGDFDRAAADFRTASQRDPSLFEPRMNLGIACIRTGKFAEAEAALTASIHINPASAPAYTNRGIAFGSMGQNERAIADFDTALMIDAHYGDALNNREIALRMLKGQQIHH